MKPRYYGIAELALVVSDLERSKHFYVDIVGFEPLGIDVGPGGYLLRIGKDRNLGLWEPGAWHSKYLPPGTSGSYFGRHVSPAHPVFAVNNDDIGPLAERLKHAGYEINGPVRHEDGALHLYLLDPDNHAIEFWGWPEE